MKGHASERRATRAARCQSRVKPACVIVAALVISSLFGALLPQRALAIDYVFNNKLAYPVTFLVKRNAPCTNMTVSLSPNQTNYTGNDFVCTWSTVDLTINSGPNAGRLCSVATSPLPVNTKLTAEAGPGFTLSNGTVFPALNVFSSVPYFNQGCPNTLPAGTGYY